MPKIKIEKQLYEKVKEFAQQAGYSSVEEFAAHVLEQQVSSKGADDSDDKVLEQLKGLGYIS